MCTRVLWNTNKKSVVAARSMDWPTTTEPKLMVMPRGIDRDGGLLAGHRLDVATPFTWTSKYGSVVTSIYGVGSIDGMNERGLGIHALYLTACDFGELSVKKPTIHAGYWVQVALDLAGSVAEALELLGELQIAMVDIQGRKSNLHLALEDASGDSAIIEFVNRKMTVRHGREYVIMTNDPTYDEQLKLLAAQDFSHPNRDMPLPGNVNARDRFQRAAYYHALLPEPANIREAVAGVLAVVRNCSVPFGAPYGEFGIYNTEYRTVVDLTDLLYFFELTTSPNVLWVSFSDLDLKPGAPLRILDPNDISLSGEVSSRFTTVAVAPY